ncbi:c-type cytochrome [Rhizobium sp. CRIBSB]|nr:c-type cytochrome [Rhizobium sp. CRIBSB]
MTRILTVVLAAACLASCGEGASPAPESTGGPTPSSTAATPSPVQTAGPSEAEKAVILASLPAPYNAADLENGRRAFARCRSCHTLPEGGSNMTGPNLWAVFGRVAGTHPGFNYSPALKAAGFAWDAEKLDAWLAGPRTFLPGNKMAFAGLPDATDRRDVIAYLKVETGYTPPAS